LRSLTVAEVVERLTDRFGFLTRGNRAAQPRQQSLHAMINWSYELCSEREQLLWTRLSVFPGSVELAAVEAVCSGEGLAAEHIVDLVDNLVAKSVLLADQRDNQVRYRMLATVREFGAGLLAQSGAECELRRRHCQHYLARAQAMATEWCGPGQAAALARMRSDHPNLIAALEWSVSRAGHIRVAAALASTLRYHWIVGGFLGEGRRWLEQILDGMGHEPDMLAGRGAAAWVVSWAALVQGDWTAGLNWLTECGTIAEQLGDASLAAHVAHWSGLGGLFTGDHVRAITLFDRAIDGHRAAGDTAAILTASFQFAVVLAYEGQLSRARFVCRESIELADRHGERWARAYLQWASAIVHWREGAYSAAEEMARKALSVQHEFRDGICVALSIELLAWAAAAKGKADRAAELLGAAHAIWAEIGTDMHAFGPALESDSLRTSQAAEQALGPRRFGELSATGRNRDMAAAIALALDAEHKSHSRAEHGPESSPLTRRENDVARLIAQGLSNRAIAETLVLSPRTIDGHVEHIFTKLGFSSRAQVAAWVTEHLPEQATNPPR
jgi:DNA-binding CsgD family transcriptional regulator